MDGSAYQGDCGSEGMSGPSSWYGNDSVSGSSRWTEQGFLAHLWTKTLTLTRKSLDSPLGWENVLGSARFFHHAKVDCVSKPLPWPVSWAEGRPSQSVPRARAGSASLSYPGAWGRRANTKTSSEEACWGWSRRLVPAGFWATGALGKDWQPRCRDSGGWRASNAKAGPREVRRGEKVDFGVQHTWTQISSQSLYSCVTTGKALNLAKPHFHHL